MKYAVIRGETYTGAIYTDLTQDMIDHHTNQNEWFHPVTDRFIMKIDPDTRQVVDVPSITKKNALDYVLDVIDRKYKDVSYPVFTYIHVFSEVPEEIVSYPIHNDLVTIQGQFVALSLLDPVSTITWKTAQKESDGVTNVYIDLTIAEFTSLAGQYFMWLKTMGFDTMDAMKNEVKAVYLDDESTISDIISMI